MSAWRNCKASIRLATEINGRWPNRDRLSDGTIGDATHAARNSDHNPWIKDPDGTGVVRARDIDEDPTATPNGVGDANVIAEHHPSARQGRRRPPRQLGLRHLRGPHRRRQPDAGPGRWEWRPYTGTNAHRHHARVVLFATPRATLHCAGPLADHHRTHHPTTPNQRTSTWQPTAEQSQIEGPGDGQARVGSRDATPRTATAMRQGEGPRPTPPDDDPSPSVSSPPLATPDGLA